MSESKYCLIIAASHGDVEALSRMIAGGSDIYQRRPNGTTPIHAAIMANQVDCLNILIAAGADLTCTYAKMTPAELSINFACHRCLERLINAGAKPPSIEFLPKALADYADSVDEKCRAESTLFLIKIGSWDKSTVMEAARKINSITAKKILAMLESEDLTDLSKIAKPSTPNHI